MKLMQPNAKKDGFTLIEIVVAICIVGIILAIGIPAISSAIRDGKDTRNAANVQTLNQAANRARLSGLSGAGTYGNSKSAALDWYKTNQLINNSANISLDGIFYSYGIWEKHTVNNETEALALLADRQSTPEEDLQQFYNTYGVSSLEELAESWGYSEGDIPTMLTNEGVSSLDELGQLYGYADYTDWVTNWWGWDPGPSIVANWMGYIIPGTANTAALLADVGYDSIQSWATASFSTTAPPILTESQVRELTSRIGELGPEVFNKLMQNESAFNNDNLLLLQTSLSGAITNGETSTWTTEQVQTPLWNMFTSAITQNANGQMLSQMDFSALDLSGRSISNANLQGANITGAQLNNVVSLTSANLSGLNLTGFNAAGKSLVGVNFSNVTGIRVADLTGATNLASANLSGMDFAGANLTGKSLSGVTINGALNFNGSSLNGVTSVSNLKLQNLDLTGWTTFPTNAAIGSLAGSTLSPQLQNAMFNTTGSAPQLARTSLSGFDMTGITVRHDSYMTNYTGAVGLTGANFVNNLLNANLGTTNMTGYNWAGKSLRGSNLSNVTGLTGANLNLVSQVTDGTSAANFTGQDLSGWTPSYSLQRVNLTNVKNITADTLVNSTNLLNLRLTGTGITKQLLDEALVRAGKNPAAGNYNTSTIIF